MPKKELYILTFFLLFSFEISAQKIDDFVSTSSGKVQGYLENKVINYDDIPYAKPPVGDLRWKAPREILDSERVIKIKIIIFVFKNHHLWEEHQVRVFLQDQKIVYI